MMECNRQETYKRKTKVGNIWKPHALNFENFNLSVEMAL
jgi:hypothetical protein